MKILHVIDHSLPLHSGYTFRSQNIFLSQQKVGLEVVVLTSPKHEQAISKDIPRKELIDGVTYYRTGPSLKCCPIVNEIALISRLQKRIADIVHIEKPDVIHAHSPVLNGIPAVLAGRKSGLPVVYEIRAFWEDAAVDHGTCREWGPRYRLTRNLETWVCKKADLIIPICQGLKEDLVARKVVDAAKVHIVGNAIDIDKFEIKQPSPDLKKKWRLENGITLGFVGSFYHYEGLELAVHGLKEIIRHNPETKLLLVGGGPMEMELKRLVESSNLQEHVVFTGRLPHEQMADIYALIDILVLPRLSMRLTETVTPLKPLEAMAMKKAVLASDVGGHRELIDDGKTGVLFKAGDLDDFVEKTLFLISSPAKREKLGECGVAYVRKERSWLRNGKKYERLYNRVLG